MHQEESTEEENLCTLADFRGRVRFIKEIIDLLIQLEQKEFLLELSIGFLR